MSTITVLFVHVFERWFPALSGSYSKNIDLGHVAVVVFFVLSGYVIAYTTITNNRGYFHYITARLSRLYSIVIPALIITLIIELFVWHINPSLHAEYSRGSPWLRYILSALFLNESWLLSAAPPFNGPLWSLGFEFWYYAIFGLFFYKGNGWKSYLLPLLACLIAGPKILIMMIIWLSGYFAYKIPRPIIEHQSMYIILLIICGFLIVSYIPPMPFKLGGAPFYFANQFITDWIFGLSIACILWILPLNGDSNKKSKTVKKLRTIADLTFPVYVLHYPFIILFRCIFPERMNDINQFFVAVFSVLLSCCIIGYILEKQRYRSNRLVNSFLGKIKSVL
ncbi:MAG: hypothetical protein JWR12_588 [Mucilaginibacter sp.]|nr:hypothetical protein [Mucilaginibacter sp.]